MKKVLFIFLYLSIINNALGSIKENIINNLKITNNLSFDFEQNINGKIETGNCIIEYPKKILCKYNKANNKILVSNGKSLVIKTQSGSYYRYSIESTPLNYILDKNFLIRKIYNLNESIVNNNQINFSIQENDIIIDIFFDNKTFNLIGWQTKDIYQNINVTYLSSIQINQKVNKNLFKLPSQN